MNELLKTYFSVYFLIIFKNLKNDFLIKKFLAFLKTFEDENNFEKTIETYCDFVSILEEEKCDDFSLYIKKLVYKTKVDMFFEKRIQKELNIITKITEISFEVIKEELNKKFEKYIDLLNDLPEFKNTFYEFKISDFSEIKIQFDELFEKNRAFIFDNSLEIKPIEVSENLSFKNLKGYAEQKKVLYENTKALLEGLKVNNILLYGDAGCGKSSSVRALLNEFSGLKIVQIFKNNLINLDKLYEKLKNLPYKFIIFADDISFDEADDTFSTMKAVLDGSLIQCPKNAVIYATSNRRHLVKESFQARKGDEIHLNDTINELNSLSERFGINLLFSKPNNNDYIQIVLDLAKDYNIDIDKKVLVEKAQRIALIKGSTSPRIARQLIDNLIAHVEI